MDIVGAIHNRQQVAEAGFEGPRGWGRENVIVKKNNPQKDKQTDRPIK